MSPSRLPVTKQCKAYEILSHFLIITSIITERASAARISSRKLGDLNVTTPDFGGCKVIANDQTYCSVKPDLYCKAGEERLPQGQVEDSKCKSPLHVNIGRCGDYDSSVPGSGSCSAFASSCPDPAAFRKDSTCTLVEDKSVGPGDPDMLTHYPYCHNKITSPGLLRCVLSDDDCIYGEEEFYNFTKAVHYPHCFCDAVPIGMCSIDGEDEPLTEDNTICAVAKFDCPPEMPKFTDAYDLKKMTDPPRKCRLCDDSHIEKYSLHEFVVESGRCIDNDDMYGKCALEKTECVDPYVDFAAIHTLNDNMFRGCHANAIVSGMCVTDDDDMYCTNYDGACEEPSSFQKDEACTVYENSLSNAPTPTYFGRCRSLDTNDSDNYRCVWHERECEEGEEWLPASKPTDWYDGCKCEDVVTGACVVPNTNETYCAVSVDGCANGHSYRNSSQTHALGITCHLCQRSRTIRMTEGPTARKSNEPSYTDLTFPPTKSSTPTLSSKPSQQPSKSHSPSLSQSPSKSSRPTTNNPTKKPTTTSPTYYPTYLTDKPTTDQPTTDLPTKKNHRTFNPTYEPTSKDQTFPPTTTEEKEQLLHDDEYDDFDDDYDFDRMEPGWKRKFELGLMIGGTVGGTILFTCLGVLFYQRKPLLEGLYSNGEEVELI